MKPKYQRLSPNIINWRNQWAYYFNFADEIEVFSRSSNEILNKIYPQYSYKINIKPHKLIYIPKKVFIDKKSPIVIGVLGSIGYQKGAKILNELAQVVESNFKIVVIGEIDPAYSHPKIQIHGRFLRHEISDLTVKYSINKWFIPSICPETFSYTTHECIATGLRVYAFNIGAQADAASNYDSLSLIPLNSNIDFIVSILSESI
jgi:glycosyltransferase involved in cell wall biosynthesis